LTGHLVLSTLHTNDAPSTITRLLNMGVEPFLVTASLNAIVAQRLLRKVCQECKTPKKIPQKMLVDLGMSPEEASGVTVYEGKGCDKCNKGYKGRIAIYEVLVMHDELKEMVLNGASAMEIKKEAIRLGMNTLRRSALNKLKEGTSSIEEVIRVTAGD